MPDTKLGLTSIDDDNDAAATTIDTQPDLDNAKNPFRFSSRSPILSGLLFTIVIVASSLFIASIPSAMAPPTTEPSHSLHSRSTTEVSVPSVEELESYVQLAYAAFCEDEELGNWTCQWCLDQEFQITSILYNEITKTRGYVGYLPSQNLTIASFRGSYGHAENWWLNLRLGTTTNFYNVRVRTGWLVAYQALQEQLFVALQQNHDLCPSCSTLVTTGHSLGATIGALAALDVKLSNSLPWIERVEMRTFGMPRVGHKDFAELFQANVDASFRVVHYRDIVPHYPVRPWHVFPYHHVGTELWVPQKEFNGTLKHCDGSGEDQQCSNSVPIWQWDPDDHNIYMGLQNNDCGRKS